MKKTLHTWAKTHFNDPEQVNLWVFLLFVLTIFGWLGSLLAPVFVAVVIAYLLQWPLVLLQRLRLPRVVAVLLVYSTFMGLIVGLCGLIVPLLINQLRHLLTELPNMASKGQALVRYFPEHYAHIISPDQIQSLMTEARWILTRSGQWLLSFSLNSLSNIVALSIYLVLVPLLIYFFLMDQKKILHWVASYLPKQRRLIREVWEEVYAQTGNYVRGKALEIVIVWGITSIAFGWIGLPYAMLLGFLVGLSSIIPYIGTVLVTIPVVIIALLEWGWSREFAYLLGIYSTIIVLDANVLAHLLLSEAVSLHPVAIMIAILVFGGLLGFWGVFFAVPLAVLVKALLNVLQPKTEQFE